MAIESSLICPLKMVDLSSSFFVCLLKRCWNKTSRSITGISISHIFRCKTALCLTSWSKTPPSDCTNHLGPHPSMSCEIAPRFRLWLGECIMRSCYINQCITIPSPHSICIHKLLYKVIVFVIIVLAFVNPLERFTKWSGRSKLCIFAMMLSLSVNLMG